MHKVPHFTLKVMPNLPCNGMNVNDEYGKGMNVNDEYGKAKLR
jgi:hypothetical protein